MPPVLHLTGPILRSLREVQAQAWVVDGRITYRRPSVPGAAMTRVDGWVVPGFVDAHCHVGLSKEGAVPREVAQVQAQTDRDAGALLIRDAGSPSDTRWMDGRDDLPIVIRAGRHIARTKRYIRGYAHEVEPDQLVSRVQAEARAGDGWVKLVGDWIDRDAGDLAPCWPVDTLREAIAAAHALGARVTAHCFGEQSLLDFAAADVDCIEHATGLNDESIATFAAADIAVVPTLVNIATFPQIAAPAEQKFPQFHAHLLDLHTRRYATVAAAHEAGIPLYVGTDAGGSLAHGLVGQEMLQLAQAGLGNTAVLDAGIYAARRWLQRPGIEEGDPADVVVLDADPRAELAVVAAPRAVILRGRLMTSRGAAA